MQELTFYDYVVQIWTERLSQSMTLPLKIEAMYDIIPTFTPKRQFAAVRGALQAIETVDGCIYLTVFDSLDINFWAFASRFRAPLVQKAPPACIQNKTIPGIYEFQLEVLTPFYFVQRILSVGALSDAMLQKYNTKVETARWDFTAG